MKVFIRTSELTSDKPHVIAFYPDGSNIKNDAHGTGLTVLTVPDTVLAQGDAADPIPKLIKDWRTRAGSVIVESEAKRRIDEALSSIDRFTTLREVIEFVVQHGSDVSKWPSEAKARKAEIDELWRYLGEIRERARAHASVIPHDPGSDKVWPRRPIKR
jgi:hypothetical protein